MNRYAKPSNFNSRIRTPLLREHYVYRVFDSLDRLLYIGCTMSPELRLKEHRGTSRWAAIATRVTFAGPYNYETARLREYEAIESERSIYNYSRERRAIRMIYREFLEDRLRVLVEQGEDYSSAINRAMALADITIPRFEHDQLTDLSVPSARAAAARGRVAA